MITYLICILFFKLNEQTLMINIKDLTIYTSIFTSLTIFFGIIFNTFLYSRFGIDIMTYIDFGESVLLFLPFFPKILFLVGMTVPGILVLHPSSLLKKRESTPIFNSLFGGNLLTKRSILSVFKFILISLFLLFTLSLFNNNPTFSIYIFAFTLMYIILHFSLVIRLLFDSIGTNKFPLMAPLIVFLSVYVLTSTFFAAQLNISRIISGARNPDVELISDTYEISTLKSSNRYIGKTKNYIFLYDLSQKTTRVIPMNQLKEFRMHFNR